jgi:hypothetical protein
MGIVVPHVLPLVVRVMAVMVRAVGFVVKLRDGTFPCQAHQMGILSHRIHYYI